MGGPRIDRTPVDLAEVCHCPTPHRHGDVRTYGTHGCRCQPCATARWRREERRKLAVNRGAEPQYIPADDTRRHIAKLRAAGATHRAIAEAAGLSLDAVSRISSGWQANVKPAVRDRIKAVTPGALNTGGTPLGAQRRLQGLIACGWTAAKLAEHSTLCHRAISAYAAGRNTPHAATRRAIVDLYLRMWDQEPPTATSNDRRAKSIALSTAARNGWHPPAAWDDIDRDPEPPAVTEPPRRTGTVGVDPSDIRLMLATNTTSYATAERLGLTREGLFSACKRHGIPIPAHIRAGDRDRNAALPRTNQYTRDAA